ncbi:SNF2 family N-terminal domain-containing protein [Trichoderma sp. SZMC 28014]
MSNPLKRQFDPVRELNNDENNENLYSSSGIASSATMPHFYGIESWQVQDYNSIPDMPRLSQFHGPGYINPASDVPMIQPMSSMESMFNSLFFGQNMGEQMSTLDINEPSYNLSGALQEWQEEHVLSDTHFPGSVPFLSQEASQFSSLSPGSASSGSAPFLSQEASQLSSPSPGSTSTGSTPQEALHLTSLSSGSTSEDVIMLNDQDEICYGMLHNVDVKLLGEMQVIHSKLSEMETTYERFKIKKKDDHVLLSFHDADDEDTNGKFGYLRSAVGKTLMPLLAMPHVNLEPIGQASNLKDIIGRANKPAEAIAKVDINLYGPRCAAKEVGDTLSHGKLWLQKSNHMKRDVIYDNPHFLRLDLSGISIQPTQPVGQSRNEGPTGKQKRQERLQKLVREVYNSIDRSRNLDKVNVGGLVTQELLPHQQEALGFMVERESGEINDRYRLWETKTLDNGTDEYCHRITKQKIKNGIPPDESGGGILADEMGMGKTLSILALIVKTLDVATEWVQKHESSATVEEEIQRSRSTLVIVPSALLVYNWIDEINKYLKEGVKKIKYHGSDRPTELEEILDSDIVVTTYSTLKAEFQNKSKKSLLHRIDWYRIVLDEAHIIRRRATLFYRSCDELHASFRWCLTGTPIQNKLTDIGTLFAFIRAEPFSKASIFRKWIEVPFEQSTDDSNTATAVKDRLVMLIEALCLRRTKDSIELPDVRTRLRELTFTPEERKQYENTKNILTRMIRHRVGEIDKASHFGTFQMNLQMRLLCNHGTYQQPFSWRRRSYQDEREAAAGALGQNSEIYCSGCQLPMPILGSSWLRSDYNKRCNHVLCSECIEESTGKTAGCPVCVLTLGPDVARNNSPSEDVPDWPADGRTGNSDDHYFNKDGHSTKMKALIKDVEKDLNVTKRTLKLLSRYLEEANIQYFCIDGTSSLSQRQKKLKLFAKDDKTRVLIMTTGTGGFGLNLTCANRIFIVELQWNPGVESQAIARAIRLGQKSEVNVTRYLIKGTVEEEMRSQQRYKKQLAALGFDELLESEDHPIFEPNMQIIS